MIRNMTVVLIMALPVLVTADINRLDANLDLERPDTRTWCLRTQQPEFVPMSATLPVWEGVFIPGAAGRSQGRTPCPSAAPEHVTRRLAQPDCRNTTIRPALWPFAPRADEKKTAAREPRPERTRIPAAEPAN